MPRRRRSCRRRRRRSRAACEAWANPSSAHAEGRAARAALEDARRRIAAALGWDGDARSSPRARPRRSRSSCAAPRRARASSRRSSIRRCCAARPTRARSRCRPDGTLDLADLDAALARPRAAAGRGPVGQQRDRRDPSDRRHRRAGEGGAAACCSSIARRAPASCRSPTPISSSSPPTSSAGRRASAPCWCKDSATLEAVGGQEGGYRPGTAGGADDHGLRRRRRSRSWLVRGGRCACAPGSTRGIVAAGGEYRRRSRAPHRHHRRPIGCPASPPPRR